MACQHERNSASRVARLLRPLAELSLPAALLILAVYLAWPDLGPAALWSALAASGLTGLLAGLTAIWPQSPAPGPELEVFERTHTPRELSVGRRQGRDALTALPDVFALLDFGAPLLTRQEPRLLAVIELAWLGEFNLRFTRKQGDAALRDVAGLLEQSLAEGEMAARCGGAQFALLLDSSSVGESFRRLMGLQETIAGHMQDKFGIETRSHAGLAWYPRHGLNMSTLLHRSRQALANAESSDQRCSIYSPASDTGLELEQELTRDLAEALDQDALTLNFQPVIPLNSDDMLAMEVLARWEHPEWGMISPETFIALAERGSLINRLTRFVVQRAVQQLADWRAADIMTNIAINLSARDLFDDTLPAFLARACKAAGVPARQLLLEVTETAMISDIARARLTLKRLRNLGVRVIIDDFGTGYSSLAHLKQLPVDGIKIDKSFVRSLRRGSSDSTIVRVSIELAHSLGLRVTAEGVESEYIADRLEELQCDALQGFHLCPPIAAEAVAGWLLNSKRETSCARLRQQSLPLMEVAQDNRLR